MISVLANAWALLLGMGLIMLGNGLQGSLLGIRASMEGFELTTTGLVMSGYFIGLLIGCLQTPKLVARVGHIRIFGALASLASTSILVQATFVDPFIWWSMRVVTGFAYAGIYIVAESWLNEASDNESRGKLLSIYMLISLGGLAGGQLLLNVSSPNGFELFVLVSLLVSLALIPILLSAAKAPSIETPETVSIRQLYQVSPLGVVGMFVTGVAMGTVFGMGPVYATEISTSVKDVSLFMGILILGGFLFQYPLGWLSDQYGRRKIIIFCGLSCCLFAVFASTGLKQDWSFFFFAALVGGLSTPLYSLCGAHTNDYLSPKQMVAASGTLVLINASGAVMGSPVTSYMMKYFGPGAFYISIAITMGMIAIFALWRSTRRTLAADADRGEFIVMSPSPLSASLTPEVELETIEAAASYDAEEIQSSFEELAQELRQDDESDQDES